MKKILSILTCLCLFATLNAQDVKNQLNPIYHGVTSLAIAPDAEAVVAVNLCRVGVPLSRRCAGHEQHQGCKDVSCHS